MSADKCEDCVEGKYSSLVGAACAQDTCVNCASGKYSAERGNDKETDCVPCVAGKYSIEEGSKTDVCVSCGTGKYSSSVGAGSEGACLTCGAGKYSSSVGAVSEGACLTCGAGKYSEAVGAVSSGTCLSCPAGKYLETAGSDEECDCLECGPGKYSTAHGATNALICSDCDAGKYLETAGSDEERDCFECGPGKYSTAHGATNASICSDCDAGTFSTSGASHCQECPADTYSLNTGSATCISCPMNSHAPASSTSPGSCMCNKGYQSAAGGDLCFDPNADCPSGSYKGSASECLSCAVGKQGPRPGATTASACELCAAGTFGDSAGASTCSMCPAGKANNIIGSNSSVDCAECQAGTYSARPGASSCVKCAAGKYGQYSAALQCIDCHANSNSAMGSTSKLFCICNTGFTGEDGTSCGACRAGSHKPVNGSSVCILCPASKYAAAAEAATACRDCAINSNSAPSSTQVSDCTCNAGYFGPNGEPCSSCQPGKYKAVTGSLPCEMCPAGTFQNGTGKSKCAGNCSANSFSSPGSDQQTKCLCNVGYTGPNGGHCSACSEGHFKESNGSAACTACQPGKYCTELGARFETLCLSCPEKTTSGAGSTRVHDCACNAGHAGQLGGPCTACPAGFHKSRVGVENCIECLAGTYSNSNTSTFNYNQQGVEAVCVREVFEGAASCSACPAHSFSLNRSFRLRDCVCNAGFSGSDGAQCIACVPGSYKPSNGSSNCASCDSGSYSSAEGATVCSQCPPDSYAPAQSVRKEDCKCNAGLTGPAGGPCQGCEAGKYGSVAAGNIGCQMCGAGKYSDKLGSTTCFSCPQYTMSPAGSNTTADCKCNRGYSGNNGGPCSACAAGQFKAADGSAQCLLCPGGSYSVLAAASSCSQCPPNSGSAPGSDRQTNCTCMAGFTGQRDGEPCSPCAAGSYKAEPGPSQCVSCAAGKFNGRQVQRIARQKHFRRMPTLS